MKKLFEVVAVVGVTAILFVGCAGTESAAQNNSEATQETEIEESIMDPETLNQSVQDTLTYEGGLYVNGNQDCEMELAIFKNEEGESIYLIYDAGMIEYGIYDTEDAVAEDGTEYEQINVRDDLTYGYYFSEDMTEGMLVDEDGVVYASLALDERVARDLVRTTIVGE